MNNIFGQYVLNHFKQLEFSNSAQLLAFSLAGAGQVASSENLMKGSEIDSRCHQIPFFMPHQFVGHHCAQLA